MLYAKNTGAVTQVAALEFLSSPVCAKIFLISEQLYNLYENERYWHGSMERGGGARKSRLKYFLLDLQWCGFAYVKMRIRIWILDLRRIPFGSEIEEASCTAVF